MKVVRERVFELEVWIVVRSPLCPSVASSKENESGTTCHVPLLVGKANGKRGDKGTDNKIDSIRGIHRVYTSAPRE